MLRSQVRKDLFQLAIGRTVAVHVRGGARMYGCLSYRERGFLILNDATILGRKMIVDVEMLAVSERELVHFAIAPEEGYLDDVNMSTMLREREYRSVTLQDFFGKRVVVQSCKGEMYEGLLVAFHDGYVLLSEAEVRYPNGRDVAQLLNLRADHVVHFNTEPLAKISVERYVRREKERERAGKKRAKRRSNSF